MGDSDAYDLELARLRIEHRDHQLRLMAAFCKYWGVTPADYKALTVEELNAMTEFANDEIRERNRQAKKRR